MGGHLYSLFTCVSVIRSPNLRPLHSDSGSNNAFLMLTQKKNINSRRECFPFTFIWLGGTVSITSGTTESEYIT